MVDNLKILVCFSIFLLFFAFIFYLGRFKCAGYSSLPAHFPPGLFFLSEPRMFYFAPTTTTTCTPSLIPLAKAFFGHHEHKFITDQLPSVCCNSPSIPLWCSCHRKHIAHFLHNRRQTVFKGDRLKVARLDLAWANSACPSPYFFTCCLSSNHFQVITRKDPKQRSPNAWPCVILYHLFY